MEDTGGRPGLAAIGAARNEDVVEIRGGPFLNACLTGGINVVHIVSEAVGDDGPLIVIEGGIAGRAVLTDDGIAHPLKREAIVVGALHVDQSAVARVVIGDEYARAVGGDPLAVRLRRIDDLRGAVLDRKSTRLNSSHMSISYAVF